LLPDACRLSDCEAIADIYSLIDHPKRPCKMKKKKKKESQRRNINACNLPYTREREREREREEREDAEKYGHA
jgi:hypothetical protein